MDPGLHSPLVACFVRGDAPRDVKLLAARGAVAPRAHEQLAILLVLADDEDPEVAGLARLTLDMLPRDPLLAFLARADVPSAMRDWFAAQGVVVDGRAPGTDAPVVAPPDDGLDVSDVVEDAAAEVAGPKKKRLLSTLSVMERIKVAMHGTREQRALLVRDANRLVAAAVLSSPKLSEPEIEAFARATNVSDEVLRVIGTNRSWVKSNTVAAALVKNPKTPPAISLPLVSRLTERELKMLVVDRNVPEGLRVQARKLVATNESRRR